MESEPPQQPAEEITYFLIRFEKTGEEPTGYLGRGISSIRIHIPSHHPRPGNPIPCTATFIYGNLSAEFTCHYHPPSETLSNFNLVDGTAKGGMEDITSVTISFHRELDGERIIVEDDNDNQFMFVQLEFGYEGEVPISGDVWGKRALVGGWARDVVPLSEREMEELELERWDEEERGKHAAFLKERKRKMVEAAAEQNMGWGGQDGGNEDAGSGGQDGRSGDAGLGGQSGGDGDKGWTDSSLQDQGGDW